MSAAWQVADTERDNPDSTRALESSPVTATRTNPGEDRWRAKLHAVFFELAECNKELEARFADLQHKAKEELSLAGPAPHEERKREIVEQYLKGLADLNAWQEGRLTDIDGRYKPMQYNPLAFSYLTLDQPVSDQQGIGEYLHFHRHGESLRVSAANEVSGDLEAHDKIARTERDLFQIIHGKGAIKAFQENQTHRQLLQLVICFEREPLTAEELAECFDHFCACGEVHDADGLRKMRNRLEAELRKKPVEPL